MDNTELLALGLYGFFMGLERAGIRSVNMPVMGLGLAIGFFLVRKFNTQNYRKFIIAVSFVSAVRLFF